MPHVITGKCLGEKCREPAPCADICPVDCVHPVKYKNRRIMIIDPETCLDCGVCLPECPAGAIAGSADENPQWTEINRKLVPK